MDIGKTQEEELGAVFPKHIFSNTFNSDIITDLQKSGMNSTKNPIGPAPPIPDLLSQLLYHSSSLSLSLYIYTHICVYIPLLFVYKNILFLNRVLLNCRYNSSSPLNSSVLIS